MAKAELGSREVERVVTVTRTVTEKVVTLELSEEEANTLSVILSRVGGSPADPIGGGNTSPRKHADSITKALRTVGVDYYPSTENYLISGNLRFADYNNE